MIHANIIIGLYHQPIYTADHRITVTGMFQDKSEDPFTGVTMVEFDKEERGDIGRALYHRPQAMIATIENFDRLYYSKRVTQ